MMTPVAGMDEFDVYMDNVNRSGITREIVRLMHQLDRQFLLITPNEIEYVLLLFAAITGSFFQRNLTSFSFFLLCSLPLNVLKENDAKKIYLKKIQ